MGIWILSMLGEGKGGVRVGGGEICTGGSVGGRINVGISSSLPGNFGISGVEVGEAPQFDRRGQSSVAEGVIIVDGSVGVVVGHDESDSGSSQPPFTGNEARIPNAAKIDPAHIKGLSLHLFRKYINPRVISETI